MRDRDEVQDRWANGKSRPAALLIAFMLGIVVVTTGCSTRMIPQPEVPADLEVAPNADRVDLAVPSFSNPTEITNPLFPISRQASWRRC